MERAAGQQKGIGPALETSESHNIEYVVAKIVPCTEILTRKQKSCGPARFCNGEAHMCSDVLSQRRKQPSPENTAQVQHHKKGYIRITYTWCCTAYIILPQIDDVQGNTQTQPQLRSWNHRLHGPVV